MEYFDVCILQWRRLKDQLVTDKGRDNEGRGGGGRDDYIARREEWWEEGLGGSNW